jgi:hypothetical protein
MGDPNRFRSGQLWAEARPAERLAMTAIATATPRLRARLKIDKCMKLSLKTQG